MSAKGSDQQFEISGGRVPRIHGLPDTDINSCKEAARNSSQPACLAPAEPAAPQATEPDRNYRHRAACNDFLDARSKPLNFSIVCNAAFGENANQITDFEFRINLFKCRVKQSGIFLR